MVDASAHGPSPGDLAEILASTHLLRRGEGGDTNSDLSGWGDVFGSWSEPEPLQGNLAQIWRFGRIEMYLEGLTTYRNAPKRS